MAAAISAGLVDDDGFVYAAVPALEPEVGDSDDEGDDIAMLVQNLMKKQGGEKDELIYGREGGSGEHESSPSAAATTGGSVFRGVEGPRTAGERSRGSDGRQARIDSHPTVADDYIRNFCIRCGMHRTLDTFNTEWYELKARGLLPAEDTLAVPDVYAQNERLNETMNRLRVELGHAQELATKAQGTWEKLRKERDFHRMHHKRIAQEKNKLVDDMKRLKGHFEAYEPTVRELRVKYEAAMREKMLAKVERDKLAARVSALETQVRAGEEMGELSPPHTTSGGGGGGMTNAVTLVPPSRGAGPTSAVGGRRATTSSTAGRSPTRSTLHSSSQGGGRPRPTGSGASGGGVTGGVTVGTLGRIAESGGAAHKPTPLPEEMENPYLKLAFEPAHVTEYSEQAQIRAHGGAISGLAFHPTKPVLATVSDDMTWRLWAMPDAELIMTGEGHRAWLSAVDFHPAGTHLATSSGDGIIKMWDLTTASCSATFADHTQTTWAISFHAGGDFLVSGSMDHTCRLFDTHTSKVRQTLRGHVDSVNTVCWQPFAVNVATGSGDKTVSIWDIRSGLCVQTFYGHTNAVNAVSFNLRGDTLASCDADGAVRLWDIRMVTERASVTVGRTALHGLAFDRSGAFLTVACDDGTVRVIDTTAPVPQSHTSKTGTGVLKVASTLRGHLDSVQAVAFDPTSTYLVSGGNDSTVRVWSEEGAAAATAIEGYADA